MPIPDQINDVVAAEIRAHMARRQLRQSDLADLLGVAQPNVSKRLNGQTPFLAGEVAVIANWLGIDIADLYAERAAS